MLADRLRTHDEVPRDDHVVVVRDAAWSDYQRSASRAILDYRAALQARLPRSR